MALGTNKFASSIGTSVTAIRLIKNKKVYWDVAAVSVPAALLGSFLGTKLTLFLDEQILRYVLMILLPCVAIFVLRGGRFKGDAAEKLMPKARLLPAAMAAGLLIGAYDGFFGPGTGTFLILIFNTLLGFDILHASGNAKMINWASNIASVITFLFAGSVVFALAIPAALCGIAGNYIGSGLALKNGMKIIRPMLVLVLILLLAKVAWDLITTLM